MITNLPLLSQRLALFNKQLLSVSEYGTCIYAYKIQSGYASTTLPHHDPPDIQTRRRS
jgi:hypothetical protein